MAAMLPYRVDLTMTDISPANKVRVVVPGRVRNRLSTVWQAMKNKYPDIVETVRDFGMRDFLDRKVAIVDLPAAVFVKADRLFSLMLEAADDPGSQMHGRPSVRMPPWSDETGYFASRLELSEYMAMHAFAYSEEDSKVSVADRNDQIRLVPLALPPAGVTAITELCDFFTYRDEPLRPMLAPYLSTHATLIDVPVKVRAVCRAVFVRERQARDLRMASNPMTGACWCSGQCAHKARNEKIDLTDRDLWGVHRVTFDRFIMDVGAAARLTRFSTPGLQALRQWDGDVSVSASVPAPVPQPASDNPFRHVIGSAFPRSSVQERRDAGVTVNALTWD